MRPASGASLARSLRWRLIATICGAMLLIWLVTGWLSYSRARHEAEELLDGSLALTGHLLLAIMQDNEAQFADLVSRLATVRGARDDIYEPPLEFQVGRGDGAILARSFDAPELPILGVPGYSDIIRHDEAWRVLNVISADGRYRIQVSQDISLRDRAALEVAGQTVLPLLVILPLLILLIYFSVRGGLRPLDRLARDVSARTPDNLAPLSGRGVPTEARPLVTAINRLFTRVGHALDSERRFTADAAHELRTPLAALKVQTQVALRSRDAPMRDKALQQINCGVDRAGHLVEQLLRLARLDPQQRLEKPVSVSLQVVIREAMGMVTGAAGHVDRRVVEALPDVDVAVLGDPELLRIAVRNLLDNAVRYTRAGDSIRIALQRTRDEVTLAVQDSGPGVSEEVASRLGERFFRAGDSSTEGSGLGLAIVARIAELHGARLSAGNHAEGGFVARIEGLKALG